MTQRVKVRHALVTWMYHNRKLGREAQGTAFRGMIVDLPDAEAERLRSLEAVVDADAELVPVRSKIGPLNTNATNEQVMSWAMSATKQEVEDKIRENPLLAEKLRTAYAIVQEKLEEQNEFLGGVPIDSPKSEKDDDSGAGSGDGAGTDNDGAGAGTDNGGGTDEDDLIGNVDLDEVVKGTVDNVQAFLDTNPGLANAVLEAEERRAATEGKEARKGVIEAARAASQ